MSDSTLSGSESEASKHHDNGHIMCTVEYQLLLLFVVDDFVHIVQCGIEESSDCRVDLHIVGCNIGVLDKRLDEHKLSGVFSPDIAVVFP